MTVVPEKSQTLSKQQVENQDDLNKLDLKSIEMMEGEIDQKTLVNTQPVLKSSGRERSTHEPGTYPIEEELKEKSLKNDYQNLSKVIDADNKPKKFKIIKTPSRPVEAVDEFMNYTPPN